jgi:hypothetical protein
MLFKDWAEEWETIYLEPTVSPETYYSYCNVIKNHILPALGNLQLKNIKSIHVQKMLNDMTDKAPSKKMLSRAGNLTYRILKEAKRNNLIIENPAEDITVPKGTAETHRAVLSAAYLLHGSSGCRRAYQRCERTDGAYRHRYYCKNIYPWNRTYVQCCIRRNEQFAESYKYLNC